jgi:hypothetical protein
MFVSFKQMIYGVFFFFLSIAFLISNGTAQETITKEDFQSRLDRAFKLATQHVQNDEIIREIRQIFTTLGQHLHQKGNGQGFFLFFNEVIEKAPPYDGRIDSLVKWLRTLSVAGDGRIDLMARQFVIPCETILMHPRLTSVSEAAFGSSMDLYFPINDCAKFRKEIPQSFPHYSNFITQFSGRYKQGGTIRFAYQRNDAMTWEHITLFPQKLPPVPHSDGCTYPLEKWALMSPWNWQKFQVSKKLYNRAYADMTNYYINHHKLDHIKAADTAHRALWSQAFEGKWHEVKCLNNSLRYALLAKLPKEDIIAKLENGIYQKDEWQDGLPAFNTTGRNSSVWHYSGKPKPIDSFLPFHPQMQAYFHKQASH